MIFSARRKSTKEASPKERYPFVLIASNDSVFADNIAKILDQWHFRHQTTEVANGLQGQEGAVDVVLLDIRDLADETFVRVSATLQDYEDVGVVLINRPGNIVASIAGMKAGAVDEIITPFDTNALQTTILTAFTGVQTARAKRCKKPLLARFSEAMMAAAFAQGGDYEGALDILDHPPPQTGHPGSNKKK